MDDSTLVGMSQGIRKLRAVAQHRFGWETSGGDQFFERPPFDPLHYDERLPAGLTHFIDRTNVRVVQRGSGARFLEKPRSGRLVRQGLGGEHFQGDIALELLVACPINLAHASGAELFNDAEVSECCADHSQQGDAPRKAPAAFYTSEH